MKIGSTITSTCKYLTVTSTVYPALTPGSFVDRDMFMRYLGGGIGHHGSNQNVHSESIDDDLEEAVADSLQTYGGAEADELEAEYPSAAAMESSMAVTDSELLRNADVSPPELAAYNDGEEDYGYESSSADSVEQDANRDRDADQSDDSEAMDNLGAEDGKEFIGADEDLEAIGGYAVF
jgi:hypothetical protein